MKEIFAPGDLVRLPTSPEWGLGQVLTAVGAKVTVSFQHAGKRVVMTDVVALVAARADGTEIGS